MSDWDAQALRGLCGSLIGLTTIFVGLRFYARIQQNVSLHVDDWLILAAWLTYVGAASIILYGTAIEVWGYPANDISLDRMAMLAKETTRLSEAAMQVELPMFAFTKLSALFFYKRIFDVPGPGWHVFRTIIWTSVVVTVLWAIAMMLVVGLACGGRLVAVENWLMFQKYCHWNGPDYAFIISDLVLDIWVVILPIPWILRLQMSNKKKAGIVGIFLLAFVGVGAGIARLVIMVENAYKETHHPSEVDVHRFGGSLYFLDILEGGMSIIAINLPIISNMLVRAVLEASRAMSRSKLSQKIMVSRSIDITSHTASLEDSKSSGGSDDGRLGDVERVEAHAKIPYSGPTA